MNRRIFYTLALAVVAGGMSSETGCIGEAALQARGQSVLGVTPRAAVAKASAAVSGLEACELPAEDARMLQIVDRECVRRCGLQQQRCETRCQRIEDPDVREGLHTGLRR
jgi:hypothetical protein